MSWVATLPVMSLVMAMLSPCSIRKVPSVTRKLCSLVRIRSQPFNAPIAEREEQGEDDARPEAAGDLRGEHRGGERRGRHRHAGGEVELSADHQQRDGDGRNADGRGLIEDRREGRELPERRRHHPEEDEDEDRAAERARFRAFQRALPEAPEPGTGAAAAPSLRFRWSSSRSPPLCAPPAGGRPPVGGRLHDLAVNAAAIPDSARAVLGVFGHGVGVVLGHEEGAGQHRLPPPTVSPLVT